MAAAEFSACANGRKFLAPDIYSAQCSSNVTLRSIGHIARIQRVEDNDADYVEPRDMLAELREDNMTLAGRLREVHEVVDGLRDIATASLIENWIGQTERRTWFLYESGRRSV